MRLPGLCLLVLCLVFLVLAPGASTAQTSGKSIQDQIREIISSDKGTVRKWTFQPKVALVYDGRVGPLPLTDIMERIENEVDGFPGFDPVESFDLSTVGTELYGNTRIELRRTGFTTGERGYAEILFRSGDETLSVRSNIFVFFTNIQSGVLFDVLLSRGDNDNSLRNFAEGEGPCFFSMLSTKNEIQIVGVFIRNNLSPEDTETCLYEETTQALGLLEDSVDSPIFTYDNLTDEKPDKRADFTLLRALYDDSVKPGDSPEEVVELFMKNYFAGQPLPFDQP